MPVFMVDFVRGGVLSFSMPSGVARNFAPDGSGSITLLVLFLSLPRQAYPLLQFSVEGDPVFMNSQSVVISYVFICPYYKGYKLVIMFCNYGVLLFLLM